YENGQDADPNILKADTFDISQQQFIRTLQMLSDDGYIKGLTFSPVLDSGILLGGGKATFCFILPSLVCVIPRYLCLPTVAAFFKICHIFSLLIC
ncbi:MULTISPECIES: YjcQ family protein, partial [unclassified Lactobacillus]|uniref:YjcQ family protein n=1 Tax=unclassified Lactobacillus TaxID=2620435 RepID=UPI001F389EC6